MFRLFCYSQNCVKCFRITKFESFFIQNLTFRVTVWAHFIFHKAHKRSSYSRRNLNYIMRNVGTCWHWRLLHTLTVLRLCLNFPITSLKTNLPTY